MNATKLKVTFEVVGTKMPGKVYYLSEGTVSVEYGMFTVPHFLIPGAPDHEVLNGEITLIAKGALVEYTTEEAA